MIATDGERAARSENSQRLPSRLVLLGHPIAHSLSPVFQNAALKAAGIALRYAALDVEPDEFERVVQTLKSERAAGNVTVPFKTRMHDACDDVTPLASRVGAVNTFWVNAHGALVGDNTDVGGFDAAARSLIGAPQPRMTVGVLGAGGAAGGVLAAVSTWPGAIAHVYNRTAERARLLCERFGEFAQPVDDAGVIAGAQLVVNTTTVGLHGDAHPLDINLLPIDTPVVDLVYRKGGTPWVRALRARGSPAIDGLPMLVEQGALAFERWFGHSPARAVMWASLEQESAPS